MTFALAATLLLFQAGGSPPLPNGWGTLESAKKSVQDKKWKEARESADELLARKDLTPETRAEGEWVLVQTFEATSDWARSAAACTRALQEKDISFRSRFHLHKVLSLQQQNDAQGAVQAYAQAFDDTARDPSRARRWSEMSRLLDLSTAPRIHSRINLLQAAKTLQKEGSAGMQAAIGSLAYELGQPKLSVQAFDKARAVWKDDPVLLRWTLMAATFDRQLNYALSLRKELKALIAVEKKNLSRPLDDLKPLDERFSETCGYAEDPGTARTFVLLLLNEENPFENTNIFAYLLGFIKDEKLIEEAHASLLKSAKLPSQRLQALWSTGEGYAGMGKPEKALARYKEVTEANGWTANDVKTAGYYIADLEKRVKKP